MLGGILACIANRIVEMPGSDGSERSFRHILDYIHYIWSQIVRLHLNVRIMQYGGTIDILAG